LADKKEIRITPRRAFNFDFADAWQHRELVYYFAWKDIKVKYTQTYLGIAWAVLQPLLLMGIFYFVFFKSFNVSVEVAYPVYVFAGLILWGLFSSGITNSCDNMINSAQIIRKIYFPRLIIPLSSFAVALVDFLVGFILLIILFIILRQPVSIVAVYCIPLAILIVFISSFGIGALLSALTVKFRDFRYVLPFGMQILFFSSQVIYSIRFLEVSWLKPILYCNPLNGALELFYYPMHNTSLNVNGILTSVVTGILFFAFGLTYFKKTEKYFADII
jgi:lipopolysaccharide transport system permease protein